MTTIKNEKFLERLQELLQRKVENSTVAVDIPRLIKNIIIVDNEENLTFMQNTNSDKNKELHKLLNKLTTSFDNKKVSEDENFEDVDLLKEFFKNLGDASKTILSLKAVSQSVIILPVTFIRLQIPKITFKDTRDGWKIEINIKEKSITHKRKEQVFNPKNLSVMFEFSWDFKVQFKKDTFEFDFCTCNVNIADLGRHNFPSESKEIENAFLNMGVKQEIESAKVLAVPKNFYKLSYEMFKKKKEEDELKNKELENMKEKNKNLYFLIGILILIIAVFIKKYLF